MVDLSTIASVRARVELELACGHKDLLARVPPIGVMVMAAGPPTAASKPVPVPVPVPVPAPVPAPPLAAVLAPPKAAAPAAPRSAAPAPAKPAHFSSPLPMAPAVAPAAPLAPGDKVGRLAAMKAAVASCTKCVLAKERTQTVFGVGDPDARLMFIGEGPGADEDRLGEPFVGKAGQLLDKIIEAMGIRRADVYIANVVKCRPPGNRVPQFEEVKECLPYLLEQIDVIRPELLVALGATAARALLETTSSMGSLRGKFYEFRGTPLLCTYHPAYLLRNPADKRKVWEDMQLAMQKLGMEVKRPAPPEPPPPSEAIPE